MSGRQIIAGTAIAFVTLTMVSLGVHNLMVLPRLSGLAQYVLLTGLQVGIALLTALMLWLMARMVKGATAAHVAALVLLGYVCGELIIVLSDQAANLARPAGPALPIAIRLLLPLLFIIGTLVALARREPAGRT